MKNAFFIFGMSQNQDLFPVLFEILKNDDECWVCFFDCFNKKRQLANYTYDEIFTFFKDICQTLNYKMPELSFFGINDQKKYSKEYKIFNPEIIFIQEIKPKFFNWYPKVSNNVKVIHFAWWNESKHLYAPNINVSLSILKQQEDLKYGYEKFNTKYFGNLRMDHLHYLEKKQFKKKRCFIPESYLRMSGKNIEKSKKIIRFCNRLIKFLKDNDFEIIWKKREKGYPVEGWASPLDFCEEKPDIIIEKDLNFPSSLIDYSYNSDICLVINDCFAFFDMIHVNTNCYVLETEGGRRNKLDEFFVEKYNSRIINMKNNAGWEILKNKLKNKNNFKFSKEKDLIANKIIKYSKEL